MNDDREASVFSRKRKDLRSEERHRKGGRYACKRTLSAGLHADRLPPPDERDALHVTARHRRRSARPGAAGGGAQRLAAPQAP